MKKSVKKKYHNGIQPIRVLKFNLINRLVNRNEDYIKHLQSSFKLDKSINYIAQELPLIDKQTPRIDKNGRISIHETYLSYIWIITYSFFVLYEEVLVIPDQIKRNIASRKQQNKELCDKTYELFNYAKSLIIGYTEWDKEYYPNPEYFDEETEEGWYILRTNDLFVEVMNFILYHEIAHAELEHIKQIDIQNLSDDEIKCLELEADKKAVDLILSNMRSRTVTELSIVIGLASMLFFKETLSGGKRHPDIDKRLDNAINIINPDNESPVWAMLVLFLIEWDKQFKIGLTQKPEYSDFKEAYTDFISQVQ